MRLLNLDSRGEKIVGIQGIGGMGKTTIAKAVYDNICAGFNRCCFLENTRELLTKNDGIVSLQNKLISRILRDEVQVKNASEGVNMIREKVCKYKVLVVLDDVDDKFEFDQILGKLGDYSFESRFILTTRDKKVDERNQFWMHDLVRDLGRAIVIEEDVKNPCKRSRIWSYEDAMNVLKTKEGTDQVEMLKINMLDDDSNQKLTVKTFEKLARLKYLDMEFPRLTGDFSGILPDMRWLRLRGCQSLPTDLNLEKVVILDLEDCWVTDDWRGWSGIQVAHKLKVINLRGCYKLHKVPNLTQCENLEFIDLTNCFEMSGELRIGSFWNLKVVRHPWSGTIDLTGDMGKLQKLQEINTGNDTVPEIPRDIWQLTKLKTLQLVLCFCNESLLVDKDGTLPPSLTSLIFKCCKHVSNLLELKELEELRFMECDAAPVIPGGIWQLTKLKTLELYKCKRNGSLLADEEGTLPSSLNTLNIHGRFFRYRLPNLANLNGLTELRLTNVWITEIRGLGELRMLEVLVILSSALYNLCGLENLVNLKELTLQNCRRLESLPSLSTLVKLHSIEITKCRVLSKIQGLGGLRRSLLNLTLSDTPGSGPHKQLPDLSLLRELKELRIIGWVEFTEVKGLERLTSLKSLVMLSCLSLRRFPDLSGLKDLERLIVGSCNQLVDVTGIRGLDSLLKLELSCSLIEELPDTSGMKNLRQLDVSQCSRLTKVVGLDKLEELRGLNMCGCESIKKLPDMSRLKNLMYLNLKGCIHLKDVKGLEKLKNLGYMEMEKRLKVKHYLKSATSYGKQYGKQLARSVQNRLKN
ncbi:Disease resistance protein L6 [Linum grandiflorum]